MLRTRLPGTELRSPAEVTDLVNYLAFILSIGYSEIIAWKIYLDNPSENEGADKLSFV